MMKRWMTWKKKSFTYFFSNDEPFKHDALCSILTIVDWVSPGISNREFLLVLRTQNPNNPYWEISAITESFYLSEYPFFIYYLFKYVLAHLIFLFVLFFAS